MKHRSRQQAQLSILYVVLGVLVLVILQSWLLAPRIRKIPMSRRLELTREDRVARVPGGGERRARGPGAQGDHHPARRRGARDDLPLERATELARLMVTQYGMSERLGPLTYGEPGGPTFLRRNGLAWGGGEKGYSEETARLIDEAVRQIETLDGDELRALLAGGPVPLGA
jgi:hypothetical protein